MQKSLAELVMELARKPVQERDTNYSDTPSGENRSFRKPVAQLSRELELLNDAVEYARVDKNVHL